MKSYLNYFFLLLSSFVFSQSSITLSDSEYQKLHDKSRILLNSYPDSVFIYANKIEVSNNNLHKSFAFGIKSYLYQIKGDSIKSKNLYKKAFLYLDKTPKSVEKTKHKAYLLAYGGLSERKRGNLSKALELYLEGKKLSYQVNDIAQILKFNINISLIYGDIQNYKLAIKTSKESDLLLDKNKNLYQTDQYEANKSNICLNLGNCYWLEAANKNWEETSRKVELDSAAYFFQKAIIYSKNLLDNKVNAQIGISGVYELQKKNQQAEKSYLNLLFETKSNKLDLQHYITSYNLGRFYFQTKKYDKSIVYFNKVDSINNIHHFNSNVFLKANYCLSKIYEIKNDPEKAIKYSNIYLDNFEKSEFDFVMQSTDINSKLEKSNLKKEMTAIQEKYKNEALLKKVGIIFICLLIAGLILLLIKNVIEKNKIKKRVNDLIIEYSTKIEEEKIESEVKENINVELNNKPINSISIDEAKELEIINKLIALEEKKFYLKPEFNQQEVAKKLKTNTTYLSYIVNKNFQKTFSEYSNELRINYVINEIITNPTYRKYSTQAIAESVGYKNAISFTKSFNKRTGVTPAQFIKGIS